MTEFVIRLADERGRVQEQTHAAATPEELRARFTQAGYYVYSVKARGLLAGAGKAKKVKLDTFLVFNQQFLTLFRAGLPILSSLDLLARRQKLPHFRAQLEDVAQRVRNGESLSSAFEAQDSFPVVYTTTLLAGERSGNLDEVLQRYVDFQRVSLTFRKKLTSSLIYPAVLVVMVVCLFIFLITFVVPRFAELYDQLGTKLPAITTFLLELGRGAQHYGAYAAGAFALAVFLFSAGSRPTPAQTPWTASAYAFRSSVRSGSSTRSASSPAPSRPSSLEAFHSSRRLRPRPAPSAPARSPMPSSPPSTPFAKAKDLPPASARPTSSPSSPSR